MNTNWEGLRGVVASLMILMLAPYLGVRLDKWFAISHALAGAIGLVASCAGAYFVWGPDEGGRRRPFLYLLISLGSGVVSYFLAK